MGEFKKKQHSLDSPVCSPLTTQHIQPVLPLTTQFDDTKVDLNGGDGKFENISDNGSEISDEGYRSLGLIQATGNAQAKRASLHSQNSMEDAELNGKLFRNIFTRFLKLIVYLCV